MKTGCGNRKNQLFNQRQSRSGVQPFYTQKKRMRQLHLRLCKLSVYRLWILKIQQLIVATHNAVTDHLCRPTFLGLAI
jgi:hypothetical protein